ncbi:BnaC08g10130D [Brassica napus]|uniref:BnaC08g10130D protein n=1 Tax=Brassica napus TaxID=3708 RepID=A0A078F7Q1_BRANA|nr:BnaC08g10130D [Brassica napus]
MSAESNKALQVPDGEVEIQQLPPAGEANVGNLSSNAASDEGALEEGEIVEVVVDVPGQSSTVAEVSVDSNVSLLEVDDALKGKDMDMPTETSEPTEDSEGPKDAEVIEISVSCAVITVNEGSGKADEVDSGLQAAASSAKEPSDHYVAPEGSSQYISSDVQHDCFDLAEEQDQDNPFFLVKNRKSGRKAAKRH